ncbi:MAG TPA: hypothetical protein VHD32_00540 [Candidatus Didemnitutus sp.]|nr:hypothetical protein [Candidatus Didemnitutus sp.]
MTTGVVAAGPDHAELADTLGAFERWLAGYGETSWDHQSYFAGGYGGWAKQLYYRSPKAGILAVAPMILSEAVLPGARRLFHRKIRFPIADAHYAMGFAFRFADTKEPSHLTHAIHFLEELKRSRAPGHEEYCWGYPFDWVTRNGTLARDTPFITTLPYVYEAFWQVHQHNPRDEWLAVMASMARHAYTALKTFPASSPRARSCAYGPYDNKGGVLNASAYRSFLLTSAARVFSEAKYEKAAEENIAFVLDNQNADGSWFYATDGVRDFVDHFHTCFVMKALGKIHALTGNPEIRAALDRGTSYYLANLFDEDGLPKPFSKAPRMTVYKRELYDCAECINLCLVLRREFPRMETPLQRVTRDILEHWVKRDGSFRSRKLHLGWDNVPMHRWGQSQMFRSLAYYASEAGRNPSPVA